MIKDLSNHKWSYQNGLKGFDDELFRGDTGKWLSDELPINRRMTWYKVWIKINKFLLINYYYYYFLHCKFVVGLDLDKLQGSIRRGPCGGGLARLGEGDGVGEWA